MQTGLRGALQKSASLRDTETTAAKFKRNLAVVIGINEYVDEIPPLRTPVSDAEQVAAVLARDQGYEVQVMLIEDVTRQKLVTLFTETLPALELGSEDRLFVYFAGHGTFIQGDDGEPQYYLVPQDARASERDSFLSMRDVRESLLKLECRHLLLVLDCCFAGGFGRMRAFDSPPPKIYRQRYNFYVRSAAWQVIASAAHDETALDTAGGVVFGRRFSGETPTNSPFALALFDALHGQADTNPPTHPGEPSGDGLITITELLAFVRDRVQVQADDLSHRQTPALWTLLPKHQAGEYFFGNPQRALRLEEAPALTADTNPYRGLNAYEEMQSALFFGRNKQIQQLCALVEHQPFLAVVGASGTGKSSLVKAGLVPVLKAIATSRYMVIPPFRPTDAPLPTLEKLLADTLPEMQVQAVGFAQDQNALEAFVATWHEKNAGRSLVLVIDQFEELVTLCDENERKQFQELVANALRQHSDTLRVIVTCRTDFEPSFATGPLIEYWKDPSAELQYPEKASKTYGARYVVPLMTQDDLRQVILGPALEREVYFESSVLVEALINEVIQTPGGLPLLSFTLSEMYLQYLQSGRQDRTLSQLEYQGVGGVIGSLRNAANKVYAGLADDNHRSMMERVMLRMVAIEGGEVARRRVSTAELNYGTHENPIRQNVVNTLTNARLVVNGGEGSTTWTEPAHDALISGWDRLMEWKLRAASYLPLQRELAPAALRWQVADATRKTALLWNNDPRLSQLQDALWRTNGTTSQYNAPSQKARTSQGRFLHPVRQLLSPRTDTPTDPQWLNQPEVAFVQASVKRRSLVFQRIIGITAAVIVALTVLMAYAFYQQAQADANAVEANHQKQTAEANATAANHQKQTAEANATAANQARETAQAESLISRTKSLAAQSGLLREGNIEGALLLGVEALNLSENFEARANLFTTLDTTRLKFILRDHKDYVGTVAFSPDGRMLAAGGCGERSPEGDCIGGAIWLWDLHAEKRPKTLTPLLTDSIFVRSLAFSPDSTTLAVGSADRTLRLWDVRDLMHPQSVGAPLTGHTDEVNEVAFSPDGTIIATGSNDNTILLWDVRDPTQVQVLGEPLEGHDGSVWSIAFSPDGTLLASGSPDKTIRLWDVHNPAQPAPLGEPLTAHKDFVQSVAFSPDGMLLASGSLDQTIRLWDVHNPAQPKPLGEPLTGHQNSVDSVAFSPDGATLASGSSDNTVRLWDVTTRKQVGELLHNGWVERIAFSSDSATLAAVGNDQTIRLWDVRNVSHHKALGTSLTGHPRTVESVALSPDGMTLAAGGWDQTIRLWSLMDPESPQLLGEPLTGHTSDVLSLAISPDGTLLASGSADNTIRLWDIHNPEQPASLGEPLTAHKDFVRGLAFSPDGTILASGSGDQTIRLWDIRDISQIRELSTLASQDESSVWKVVFSSDSKLLASGHSSGMVQLWNVRNGNDPQFLGASLKGHTGIVRSVAFRDAGTTIASIDDDGTIMLWDIRDMTQPKASGTLPIADWGPFAHPELSGDARTLALGKTDGTIQLWDVSDVAHAKSVGILLTGHESLVMSIAFSENGMLLASGSDEGVTWLWDLDWVQAACNIVQRNLTPDEYAQFINSDPAAYDNEYAKPENRTCPDLVFVPTPPPKPISIP